MLDRSAFNYLLPYSLVVWFRQLSYCSRQSSKDYLPQCSHPLINQTLNQSPHFPHPPYSEDEAIWSISGPWNAGRSDVRLMGFAILSCHFMEHTNWTWRYHKIEKGWILEWPHGTLPFKQLIQFQCKQKINFYCVKPQKCSDCLFQQLVFWFFFFAAIRLP